jgi:hypothetical protein
MVTIFVPDLPEFVPLIEGARAVGSRIEAPTAGYWRIVADEEIRVRRKELGLGPALWNSALTGGFIGRIVEYDRDTLCIKNKD